MRVDAAKGFTLIELVIGMVVLSIAIVMLTSVLFPQADRAADTLHRVRSAELAHSILNEIWSKRYDGNTNPNGGVPACDAVADLVNNIPAGLPCTDEADFGAQGVDRDLWSDVDDYHGLSQDSQMLDSSVTYSDRYINYQLLVTVTYNGNRLSKLVTIDVTTPSNELITYNIVRSNY